MPDLLHEFAEQARHEMAATRGPEGRWTPATHALLERLTVAVEQDGCPRRLAEHAVTGWIITQLPIRRCIAAADALGVWREPPPRRGLQGFGPGRLSGGDLSDTPSPPS